MTHALLYFACFDTIEAVKIMSKSIQIKKITQSKETKDKYNFYGRGDINLMSK